MLCTAELIHLNKALIKMVREDRLTTIDREDLLRKAGLVKLEDGRWRESAETIIELQNS
jgi:hypothetical protein|tara:strand:+ start:163 stop:339 length:177 start_codon:yes stop_codon:yes gene_type:complete